MLLQFFMFFFIFSQELQEFYRHSKVKFVLPVPGAICVTEDKDKNWWRVEVLKAPNPKGKCKVHFIDNGNCEEVMWHGLYELDAQFYDFPRYSSLCSLKDVEPQTERWMPSCTDFFRKCVQNVEYKIELNIDAGGEAGVLHIFPDGLKINVNRLMSAFGYADPVQTAIVGPLFEADPDAQASVSKQLHKIELVDRKSFNPTKFHVNYLKYKIAFMTIEEWIQTRAMIPKRRSWKVGDKCLIFCSMKGKEKRYLRGVVKELKSTGMAEVTLMDYGSGGIDIASPLNRLAVGPQILDDVGSSAVAVHLACETMAEWNQDERKAVAALLASYQSLYISFKDNNSVLFSTSSKPRPVILWGQNEGGERQNIISVLEEMNLSIKSRFAEKSQLQVERKDWTVLDFIQEAQALSESSVAKKRFNLTEKSTATIGTYTISLKKHFVDSWLPAVPIEKKTFNAIASYVDNNGIVSLRDTFKENELSELNDLINHFYKGIPDSKHHFKVGDPCIVLFENDARK